MPEQDLRFRPDEVTAPPLIITLPPLAIGGQVQVRWDIGNPTADWRGHEGDVWRPLGEMCELGGSVEVAA